LSTQTIYYPDDGNAATFLLEEQSWWYRHRNRIICTLYKKYEGVGENVFADIGGGNGIVAKALQQAGIDVCMIEPYATGVSNAKARGVHNVLQATLETLPTDFNMEAAGMFDVLEHLPNDAEAIAQVAGRLPLNGIFIATVPAFNFLYSETDRRIGHFRRYTKKQLSELLQSQGFIVEYSSYFFSPMFVPMWLVRKKITRKQPHHNESRLNEHTAGSIWLNSFLFFLLTFEKVLMKLKIQMPIGTSCIIVARKNCT